LITTIILPSRQSAFISTVRYQEIFMPPAEILGLDHIVLRTSAPERLIAFYCEVLGLAVERRQSNLGLTQLRAGSSMIDILAAGDARVGAANVDHFALALATFDEPALRTYLDSQGVEIVEAGSRYGAGGEGPSLYVRDPAGNKVELKGPGSPPASTKIPIR
jgi:glyoxylase I family protein